MQTTHNTIVSLIIRELRIEKKYAKIIIAQELDMTVRNYSEWENGKIFSSQTRIFKVAEILGLDIETLLKKTSEITKSLHNSGWNIYSQPLSVDNLTILAKTHSFKRRTNVTGLLSDGIPAHSIFQKALNVARKDWR